MHESDTAKQRINDEGTVYLQMKPLYIVNIQGKGQGVVTKKDITQGEKILRFSGQQVTGKEVRNPNTALQVDQDLFLESDGANDECLNHSCNPNCYIDFEDLTLRALKDIRRGEELTFDYNTSEYDLIDQGCAFLCLCGSKHCIGDINGLKYAPLGHRKRIEHLLSPFLRRKMQKETPPHDPKRFR
jgi:hypothetical protein